MIALDFDGVVANYGDHTTQMRYNDGLFALLPHPQPVAICSNQGGMAFNATDTAKYPTPERVADRLYWGSQFLLRHGYPVQSILVAAYHPKATEEQIQHAARKLRARFYQTLRCDWSVYTTERARKPHPLMLRACGATSFYGDSPEDGEAAAAAGIPFVLVPRFL